MFEIAAQIYRHAPMCGVAASIGRTLLGGRGRVSVALFLLVPTVAVATVPDVPSGGNVALLEVLEDATDPDAVVFRARYVMPQIARSGAGLGYDDVADDFGVLCETHALPLIRGDGFTPARIVVSLSDRATEFGVPDPDATQFFEAFGIQDDACIWEEF